MRLLILAWADARERAGKLSVLAYAAITLWLGTLAVPDAHAAYFVLDLNGSRGTYNSAWVSGTSAFVLVTLLAVAGIFPVRVALERDRLLRTQALVAASAVPARTFVLAKWLSNLAVLGAICAVFVCGAVAMQLVRGEDRHVDLVRYGADFALLELPFCALVAAVAVAFESVAPLRGALGGAVYVLAMFWCCLAFTALRVGGTPLDPLGFAAVMDSLADAVRRASGHAELAQQLVGTNAPGAAAATFLWNGVAWTAPNVLARMAWLAAAPGLALLAAARFGRRLHDAAPETKRHRDVSALRFPVAAIASPVTAELAVVMAGVPPVPIAFAFVVAIVALVVPLDVAWHGAGPVLAILPLTMWSALSVRDARSGATATIAAASRSAGALLAARLAAGTIVAVLPWTPLLARAALAGEGAAAGAAVVVLTAVTAAALALGAWTRSPHAFEGVFVIAWFLGPLNHVAPLDTIAALTTMPGPTAAIAAVTALAAFAAATARARTGYGR